MLVAAYHAVNQLVAAAPGVLPSFEAGSYGVDIFFVISGFVIWKTTAQKTTTPSEFLQKRAIRIVPLYWVLTILAVLFTPDTMGFVENIDIAQLITSLLFVPYWDHQWGMVVPALAVGWTLNLEMAFYAVFAATLLAPTAWRALMVATVLLAACSIRLFFPEPASAALNLYSNSIVIEFICGIFLGQLYMLHPEWFQGGRAATALGVGLVMAGFAPLLASDVLEPIPRGLRWGAPALLLCAGGLLLEPEMRRRPVNPVLLVGAASYSIYLTHSAAIQLSDAFLPSAWARQWAGPVLGMKMLFILAAGIATYFMLEKPLGALMKKRARTRGSAEAT